MSNTPSDAEILALAQQHLKAFAQFSPGEVWLEGEVEFARAVLEKWGTPQPVVREPQCWCLTCRPMRVDDPESIRMALCPTCGNKRCPKANNHSLACSGSNAPGQPGSSWEHVQPAAEIGKAMQQEHRRTTP